MKTIAFELAMPDNNAWNGKWTGEGKCYCIIKSFSNTSKLIPKLGYYSYSFGDGWRAAVTVREVTSSAAKQLRKESQGFCGYDWMVDSILSHGEIRT